MLRSCDFAMQLLCFMTLLQCWLHQVSGAATDSLTWGGSNDRSGYETNHNMDPSVVGSSQFGQLYARQLPGRYGGVAEQIFASPLIYTGPDNIQYVYIATSQNNIYKIVAKTGTIVASRNLARPFRSSDLGQCNDINPYIGITATGVIDPATGTWYLTSKTYVDPSDSGAVGNANARYYVHALSVDDLSSKPNFPVNLENTYARNNPVRWFTGGVHHQRPGLLLSNQFVYIGFASHCIQYNYTGWIMGLDKSSGQIVERWASEGAGVGPGTSGAGIWMSGGGIASDNAGSMWFSTGNGGGNQLSGASVDGRTPPTGLEEAVVHAAINADGTISIVDFFMPWEKTQLDFADKDLGTTPFQLLPDSFSCGSVRRIGVVTGKSGKSYFLNVDDLGGYKNGPNRLDDVISWYQHENIVYSGAGVYPLDGGYVYINVVNNPTRVFKFSCQNGVASFDAVATTAEKNAYILGVGHGTVTSLNGQPGTGIFWVSDVQGGNLRIYKAVPEGGTLKLLNSFNSNGATKFTKLAFGDGIVFQGSTTGYLYAYGSPVNLPLECTPIQFDPTNINSTSTAKTIQCQAKSDLTISGAAISGDPNFLVQNVPSLPLQVLKGSNFSLAAIFRPQAVGSLSSSIILNTTQKASGFTNTTAIKLTGTGQSQNALLQVSPPVVSWNGVVTNYTTVGENRSVIISNRGNSVLSITNILYSVTGEKGPWIQPNGTQGATRVSAFTFYGMPSTISPNTDLSIPINFNPSVSGPYAAYVRIESNGGNAIFDTIATGYDQPSALLEFENISGGWTAFNPNVPFNFGDVKAGSSLSLKFRITNTGSVNSAPLALTVSKPPFGNTGSIIATTNARDLAEGTQIPAGSSSFATLFCAPPRSQINVPSSLQTTVWTMNLNDPDFGHTLINFSCNAVTNQYAPFFSNGSAIYQYAGCYLENTGKRQLQRMIMDSGTNMTNELCISQCSAAGYVFAGTQYRRECWCGGLRPATVLSESSCTYECTGNPTEYCGGNGADGTGASISLFGDRTRWDGDKTKVVTPYVNPGVYGYTSIGCWTDATNNRALGRRVNANNTIASCLLACQGSTYAGVEYGGECYCDSAIRGASTKVDLSDCSMACNNNITEPCGGPSRLNMYQFNSSAASTTASTTSSTARPSTTTTLVTTTTTTASQTTSITTTTSISTTASTTSSNTTTTISTTKSSTTTTMTTVITTTSTTTTSSRSTTVSTTATATGPAITNLGCATDNAGQRGLNNATYSSDNMTIDNCINFCVKSKNMPYMAVEYGRECYCGYTLNAPSTLNQPASSCNMACSGDATTKCGGAGFMNVYRNDNYVPTSNKQVLSENYLYRGCYLDQVNNQRTLGKGYSFTDAANMTQGLCVSTCKARGYTAAGVEYARECWCSSMSLSGATKASSESECNMQCTGNVQEWCGGPSRLNIWSLNENENER